MSEYGSCKRKVKYGHMESAEKAVVAMREKRGAKLEAYKCRYCDGFHVGTKFKFLQIQIRMKTNTDYQQKSGIVRMGHHLAYGWGHGWFQIVPYRLQRPVVNTWNVISCALFGHSYLVQEKKGWPVKCTACCRVVKNPKTEPIKEYE